EYVVLHEIAHLTHPNHSKEFYAYVASYMPDWKVREKRLK
ncbi:M48 family metallopeptidase, partial [Francisella tularensis subsp. holarctica]